MNMWKTKLIVATFMASLVSVCVAVAYDDRDTPIPEARQARLLEKFGDEGIDSDGDRTLTREEVRAFFDRVRPGDRVGRRGCDGCKDGFHRGPKGQGRERMGGAGRLLQRYDLFDPATPPIAFDLEKHPEADLDENGDLSSAEWSAFAEQTRERMLDRLSKQFTDADADGDGTIGEAELAVLRAEGPTRARERCLMRNPEADLNGDGVLSDDEFEAVQADRKQHRRTRMLERRPEADLDGDGVLSDEESRAFQINRGDQGRRRGPWNDARRGERAPRCEARTAWMLERHPEADTDGDGTLSEEELQAFMESRPCGGRDGDCPKGCGHGHGPHGKFPPSPEQILERHPEADTDGDGTLSDEELRTFRDGCGNRDGDKGRRPRHGNRQGRHRD